MRRVIASLTLVSLICFAAHAAAPPAPQDDPTKPGERFTMTTPRSLADLRKLEERIQWVIKRVQPSVVGFGGGSAVVVSKDGLILTVAHVGQKAGRNGVFIFPDGKRVKGKTLGNYHGVDAGVAKITDKGTYPFTPMGRSSELKVGQWVVAMGFPISFNKGL
jgi:serine protease Do